MGTKFFLYALVVTILSTGNIWVKMLNAAANSDGRSSWSSHTGGGGGSYGGGVGGGGGHK
jgi:hypothetical protein